MAGKLDDEYVANLLKQDAKKATKTYELVGIDAFNPRRAKSGAPKPNTNFLRHIIRQTDSHNAALLAKEAEESNARLKLMNRENERARRSEAQKKQKKAEGRLTPVPSDEDIVPESSKRQRDRRDHGKERDGRRRARNRDSSEEARYRRDRDSSEEARYRRHRDSSEEARRRKRRHDESDDDRPTRKRRRSKSLNRQSSRHRNREDDDRLKSRKGDHVGRHKSQRSYSRSTSRSPSRTHYSDRRLRRQRSRNRLHSTERPSKSRKTSRTSAKLNHNVPKSSRQSASPASDSDPLEAIVGPLPPPTQPTIRSRGRGAHKANAMGIESRFSSTYNPSIDMRPDSDADDDWGDALEVLKDRQRWQQQGADRLKAAGFSEEQIRKWEKGEEQTEEDVVWTRKGQAREWDRGKVVGEEGNVELKADFGRLK
ncbi:hypothetical protein T440DRAFT_5107 [Plenodomus tracheiphilus IPT5]|uniref:BZIP domain-containing protein n=1 Tax=Plenodomus tracheiphilus IPT5 TaxID=1408161 RepID=A0A6A7BMJ3_9PLEO|nr:hypothetical protein T440DRAFT_5107 [Plenodomus tracheiphilus IPT5]